MKYEIFDYFIRCSFCNDKISLKEAVLDNWRLCDGCHLAFCKNCTEEYNNNAICPGSVYSKEHQPLFSRLPIRQMQNIAKELVRGKKEGTFISRLFYEQENIKAELTKPKKKKDIDEVKILRFREEQWKKFGTVLVKRKDGKFISWGQID